MQYYHIMGCFRLLTPIEIDDDGDSSLTGGYYRNLAVAADDEVSMKRIVDGLDSESKVDWGDSTVQALPVETIIGKFNLKLLLPICEGIFYKGARVFFPASDSD